VETNFKDVGLRWMNEITQAIDRNGETETDRQREGETDRQRQRDRES